MPYFDDKIRSILETQSRETERRKAGTELLLMHKYPRRTLPQQLWKEEGGHFGLELHGIIPANTSPDFNIGLLPLLASAPVSAAAPPSPPLRP